MKSDYETNTGLEIFQHIFVLDELQYTRHNI